MVNYCTCLPPSIRNYFVFVIIFSSSGLMLCLFLEILGVNYDIILKLVYAMLIFIMISVIIIYTSILRDIYHSRDNYAEELI